MTRGIGIDFGTTNSSIAVARDEKTVEALQFRTETGTTETYRSVLYFEPKTPGVSGPKAIERYLSVDEKGRLIQSLKSFLASRTFTGTNIYGRPFSVEDLITIMLRDLRIQAEEQIGTFEGPVVVGRPVRYSNADTEEDNQFALDRLKRALDKAGIGPVIFEYEPVAAAYSYESTLDHDELILIGDFGGGTSDFSLLRVGPLSRTRGPGPRDLLGYSGVGLAGDAFDARIVRKLVSPALGSNSEARSLNKILPAVPAWIYANLERWHYLSFLRTNNVREILKSARIRALEPEKIEALIAIIEQDLGYQLHQAVQRVKFALSQHESAEFRFHDCGLDLRIPVTRREFEIWIADDLKAIEQSVDSLLETAGIDPREVDRVFLTGGSSFVPAGRRVFTSRFGKERIRGGHEFTSVAHGLALRAQQGGAG